MPGGRENLWKFTAGLALAAALAVPAAAQLPGLGGLPKVGTPSLPEIGAPVAGPLDLPPEARRLTQLRRLNLDRLIRQNRREIDIDDQGAPVVRGQVLAVSPSARSLDLARSAGFGVLREERIDGLGVVVVTHAPPAGMDARRAVRRLRKADPDGEYDYNHIYSEAGVAVGRASPAGPSPGGGSAAGVRIGLIDTGVDAGHPALAGGRVEQRGFAPGGVRPAAHGTGTASLIVGRSGAFQAPAAGAVLLVADVYGGGPTGGSTDAVVRGLGWLAASRVQVINVSLVGPPNAALRATIRGLAARGVLVVAAVGNDGPAAPPLYPASWPEVVAVTGVDSRGRVLLEAGRGEHLDFAAPGSEMAAAAPGGGFVTVRGTSFAAPIVAGMLAGRIERQGARGAVASLGAEAQDLGPRGPDRQYGRGVVGARYRVPPQAVRARPARR